ncbi:uncharacterized protein LOC141595350 [Silene latifolia]|uniref:uncharacterized protein LOC141595350 n=1 Tax=Silene latifolia TaxID=37657 RepID=UPI003D7721A2
MALHDNNDNDLEAIVIQVLVDESTDDMDDQIFQTLMEQQRQILWLTRQSIIRDRKEAHERLVKDYFAENSLYPPQIFRRRFRVHKYLFLHVVNTLSHHSQYFQLRYNAAGIMGLSPIQKCTAAIRQLAYGCPPDTCDDYIKIGETTARECLVNFCHQIVQIFGKHYLRRPTAADVERLLEMHNMRHGFPVAGANNDINVLRQSPLFNDVVRGYAPEIQRENFIRICKKRQERMWKEHLEFYRLVGELNAARFWDRRNLKEIMYACIILHNMIVENEGDQITNFVPDIDEGPPINYNQGSIEEFRSTLHRRADVRDRDIHHQLRADLVEHIWQRFGGIVEIN